MKKVIFAIAIIATLCTVASCCNKSNENKEENTEVVGCAAETDSLTIDSCNVEEVAVEETVTE